MTVYFGTAGRIELIRTSYGQQIEAAVAPADVNTTRNAFGFRDVDDTNAIITGDLLEIKSTNGRKLEWLAPAAWGDGQRHADIKAYVHINQAGQVRLYEEFEDAVNDEVGKRLPVVAFGGAAIPVTIKVEALKTRCLGNVTRYEFNSERDAVDVSQIGEEFRERLGTAISGNGTIEAFFDYAHDVCGSGATILANDFPIYLHQLIVRQQLGSAFKAQFYVIGRNQGADESDEIWYEVDGVVTNCGLSVGVGSAIQSTIQFVTTGPITLKLRLNSNYLLQEDAGRIALERLQDGFIEVEQQD